MCELGPRPRGPHPRPARWARVRAAALACDQGCRTCGATRDLEVHHRTYERWGREDIADVTVLCRGCHDLLTGAMMRRRDARRCPPPDGRVVTPIERFRPRAAPGPPAPARARHEAERPPALVADPLPPPRHER